MPEGATGQVSVADDEARERRRLRRTIGTWVGSLVGAVVLLWLASQRLPLWPERFELPRPDLLWLAIGSYLPYAFVRAARLRFLLDPLVRDASGDPSTRIRPTLVHGSGYLSFFMVLLLPLRLGELSRPLLLSRGRAPGIGFPEALGSVAAERVVDGLMVVGLLFGGLSFAAPQQDPEVAAWLLQVQRFGRFMGLVFLAALLVLMWSSRVEGRASWLVRRVLGERALGEKISGLAERTAAALRPLWIARQGLPLLGWSVVYWALTVLQLWLVLRACGLELGPAEAAAMVAIIGLSIQLPGGPAQAGSFQAGTAVGLGLFLTAAEVQGAGASFAFVMYAFQLAGCTAFAPVGAGLLALDRQRQTAAKDDPSTAA